MTGASILGRELTIIEAARSIAPRLGPEQADLDAAFGPWDDFVSDLDHNGYRVLQHWLDVFNPAMALEPFERRRARRRYWRSLGFL